ncbi:MAG TPA: hypothetical protein ENK28_04565 [Aliiroseovarius sp.]|nr:hypothetical protein [Aliiroseovarius sp.]
MRAIGKTLEALRGIDRWGTAEFLNQAFQGFTALPPPDQMSDIIVPPTQKQWWQVLGVSQDCPLVVAEGAYKALCRDRGGADVELNAAIDAARKVAP